ncbi:DUF5131 family protein [Methylobacterium aquaticum]|uniref:DUF5131 family protein n=1 Tax=Methylobacterium aquaticum TaxID=270351 RepID=UPI003D162BEA
MAEHSTIEWTDATWQIVTGCSVVTAGCTNCYAMRLAGTRLQHHKSRAGLTKDTKAGPVWTGEVRFNEQWLTQPLQWKRPRKIFVAAHGDLFHEGVPDDVLDRVFAVMALAPQHTFQVLTKRADRMRRYLEGCLPPPHDLPLGRAWVTQWHRAAGVRRAMWDLGEAGFRDRLGKVMTLPLPNVWLGVSVEDQRRADERIPDLLGTPAAVRWISAEPLLGPVDLEAMPFSEGDPRHRWSALTGQAIMHATGAGGQPDFTVRLDAPIRPHLDWVVVGGESGPGARPMHPDWARSLRDQCAAAGVSYHFKQWGAWAELDQAKAADEAGWQGNRDWMVLSRDGALDIPDGRWPDADLGEAAVVRIGKKAAGRLLDGKQHDSFPEARR